jgi:hypothetical protein
VSLRNRPINEDVWSEAAAAAVGQVLLTAVASAQPGEEIAFSLSRRDDSQAVSLVGSIQSLRHCVDSFDVSHPNWGLNFTELDDEALIELASRQLLPASLATA